MIDTPNKNLSTPSRWVVRCSNFWLIGTYFYVPWSARKNSLYELLYGFFIGIFPFVLGGMALYLMGSKPDFVGDATGWEKFYLLCRSTLNKGELLLFAISTVAPALWLATYEADDARRLPHVRPIVFITVGVFIVAVFLFGLIQAGVVKEVETIFQLSFWVTITSLLNMYLTLTYHNYRMVNGHEPKVTERTLRSSTTDFLDQLNSIGGGNDR